MMFKKNLIKSYFDNEIDNNMTYTKFIQERIKTVEKHVPLLGKVLFNYINKNLKTRDCVDEIALVLKEYAKAEDVTTAFKLQIRDFANVLTDVETLRGAHVYAMEVNFLQQLSSNKKFCSQVQNELKIYVTVREREKNLERQLKKMRASQSQDQDQIYLAEQEFIKARRESAKFLKNLEEQIGIFEKKKLNSIKAALLAWTLTELNFHAKALQLFTEAYRIADNIDVSSDMEEFRSKFRSATDTPRSGVFQRSDSMLQLITFPFQRKPKFTGRGTSHPCSVLNSPKPSRSDVTST